MPKNSPKRYSFDVYEFVASSGELYRKGYRVRLPEQHSLLLMALLERHGQVVARQDLRALLWPNGEHLDHDHAISNGINQLRAVFRDKPREPRFIETLPKRGYRFVAEVNVTSLEEVPIETDPPVANSEIVEISAHNEEYETPDQLPSAPPTLEVLPPQLLTPQKKFIWFRPITFTGIALLLLLAISVRWGSRLLLHAAPAHAVRGQIVLGIAPIDISGAAAQKLAEPFRLELMDAISQLPQVEVRATHSIPDLAGVGSVRDVAQKLQLDALLLGRVEASDANQFNFVFELVRGSDAVYLSSFHYTGTPNQLGKIRDQVQRDLFYRLSKTMGQPLKPIRSTDNPAAYSEYLAGQADLILHDNNAIEHATVHFRHAIQSDPAFARAYAALGSAYLLQAEHAMSDRETLYQQARTFSEKAISLDSELSEAHATLGFLDFRHDWNAAASEKELKKAIELDPNQAMHRIMYALLLCNTGRSAQAFEQIAQAHLADPLWPPIYITEMYVASAAGKNDGALEAAHKLLDLRPDWPLAHDQSAWAFWYAGRHEDAVREWIRMAEIEKDRPRLALENQGLQLLRKQGAVAYSRLKLAAIQSGRKWNHPNDFQLAEWQIDAMDDRDALVSLTQMVKAHDPEVLQFAASPAYLRLRNNRDFRSLISEAGLPQP